MRGNSANPDRLLAGIAARQHGIVTTAQLAEAGITEDGIRRRVACGRLHRLLRGVFAVGHRSISFEGRCMAAVLAAGGGAVLSHRSAAELWGVMPRARGPAHVTVPPASGSRSRRGLIVHRSRTLGPEQVASVAGVPLTTAARTLADLRPRLDPELHDRATRRALDLGLIPRSSVDRDVAFTRSELERRFLALCRRHRLPAPLVNARVGRCEVDFLWPRQRLVVETDGYGFHGDREAFERDRARDAWLATRGYRVLRVTYRRLARSPGSVAASVRRLLEAGAGP